MKTTIKFLIICLICFKTNAQVNTNCIKGDCENGFGIYEDNIEKWRYEGDFKDGKCSGKGTLIFSSGDKYIGDFVDGKEEGNGKYYSDNFLFVEGKYKNGNAIYGTRYWPKGEARYYTGELSGRGTPNGKGVLTGTGWYCKGVFKNGIQNWEGTLYKTNGKKVQGGTFVNGKLDKNYVYFDYTN